MCSPTGQVFQRRSEAGNSQLPAEPTPPANTCHIDSSGVVGDGLLHGWDANVSAKDNLDPTNLVVGDGIGVFEQLVMSGTVL